jgi:hypothetical protein
MGVRQLWRRLTGEFAGFQANEWSDGSSEGRSGKQSQNLASIISADWCKSSKLGEGGCLLHIIIRDPENHIPVEPYFRKTIQY